MFAPSLPLLPFRFVSVVRMTNGRCHIGYGQLVVGAIESPSGFTRVTRVDFRDHSGMDDEAGESAFGRPLLSTTWLSTTCLATKRSSFPSSPSVAYFGALCATKDPARTM